MKTWFDKIWHKTLKRPYRAACVFDEGDGESVVLLHGLGSSSKVWRPLIKMLVAKQYRATAFDLLGFGTAPKPTWIDYSVEDHARAVLAAMAKRNIKKPILLVGHSMGCLVAVHIARLQPKLVKHLVLYEMPLYADVPELRKYTMLRSLYFAAYKRILKHPEYSPKNARLVQKLAARLAGFRITKQTWTPFVKTIKHTVMQQSTLEDMKRLSIPMDVIYGTRDAVVIRAKPRLIFGTDATHIATHVISEKHTISQQASEFILERIEAGSRRVPEIKQAQRLANGG
jgi:pimeloyl-ACP methyl ester carboxylesterase